MPAQMPPPDRKPELAVTAFPLILESVTVSVPSKSSMPPPCGPVLLPVTVDPVTIRSTSSSASMPPPPSCDVLFYTVESITVTVLLAAWMPPPWSAAGSRRCGSG
jgi:hypothetical protein